MAWLACFSNSLPNVEQFASHLNVTDQLICHTCTHKQVSELGFDPDVYRKNIEQYANNKQAMFTRAWCGNGKITMHKDQAQQVRVVVSCCCLVCLFGWVFVCSNGKITALGC